MIRIVIENIFVFLVPTLAYLAWVAFTRNEWPGIGEVLKDAPLIALFISGAALMLLTLALFSTRTHNAPGETYVPPAVQDGKLQPGHTAPANK